jgi:hypothetical protein
MRLDQQVGASSDASRRLSRQSDDQARTCGAMQPIPPPFRPKGMHRAKIPLLSLATLALG